MNWQDVAVWLVVALAVGFVISKLRGRRRGPDVKASRLVRRKRK